MTVRAFAEWPKLTADVRAVLSGSEDFLTARTIGLLRFCSSSALRDVFATLGVELPEDEAEYEIDLWPCHPHEPATLSSELGQNVCEPDAVLSSARVALVIEAKFVGSHLGYYTSQLGREWLIASKLAAERGWAGVRLLTVTQDLLEPRVPPWSGGALAVTAPEQVAQFLADMSSKGHAVPTPAAAEIATTMRWSSWAGLSDAVALARGRARGGDVHLLAEVAAVLDTFGCARFTGWHFGHLARLPEAPPAELIVAEGGLFTFDGLSEIADPPLDRLFMGA